MLPFTSSLRSESWGEIKAETSPDLSAATHPSLPLFSAASSHSIYLNYVKLIPCYPSLLKLCPHTQCALQSHSDCVLKSSTLQGHSDFRCDYQWAKPCWKPLIPTAAGSNTKSCPWNPRSSQNSALTVPLMNGLAKSPGLSVNEGNDALQSLVHFVAVLRH